MGSCYSAEKRSPRKSENDWKEDADYVAFWKKVEDSKINGHDDLKTFLETNTNILIGKSIPNKAFWEKVKEKDNINIKDAIVDASLCLTKVCGTFADLTQETKDIFVDIPQKDEPIECETVFRIILDNVYNGHKLILHILDSLVEKTDSCIECADDKKKSKVKINTNKMFDFSKSTKSVLSKQTKSLVRDLIDIQRERPGDDNIKKIFQHPVIEVLILKKWDDYKMPYIRDVRRFGFVVLLFTFFVRLRILGEAKINCNPAKLTSEYSRWWNKEIQTTDMIDRMLNCGDWVGSNILEETLKRCDPADIANHASDCSDLVHNANVAWLFKINSTAKNNSHWAYNLVPETFETATNIIGMVYDRLLIFKYREGLFYISVAVMACLIFIQLVLFFWALFKRFAWYGRKSNEQKSEEKEFDHTLKYDEQKGKENKPDHNPPNRKRMNKIIMFKFVNIFYLLLGNFVCFGPFGPKLSLTVTLCVFLAYFIITEIIQIVILVVRPAWKMFKSSKGISGSIKSLVGNRYFRDPDNYLELMCFISIPLALFNQTWPKTEEEEYAEFYRSPAFCRGIIAMGVFAAWMELFIKMGNVSHSVVGNFIKMFYNIIKSNLLAYMQACLLLMTAFSLAFWIILEGHINKTGVNFSSGFWVNLVLTVTMSVGEFNTADFYDEINENKIIKVFAMLFLIGLVIFSTITMVNLLMSAIIYDYAEMKKEVEIENLYFIAEYIIEEGEYAYRYRHIKEKFIKMFQDDDHIESINKNENKPFLEFCPRLVCINCEMDPVPIPRPFSKNNLAMEAKEREPLLHRLLEIRKGKTKLCEYHGGKTSEEKVSELLELLELKKDASKHGGEISKETISEQNPNYVDHNTSQGI